MAQGFPRRDGRVARDVRRRQHEALSWAGAAQAGGRGAPEGLVRRVLEKGLPLAPRHRRHDRYYARFRKTFHVLLQLESIVLKGKDLPRITPLVDANFLSEVETLVLTAGHDVDLLVEPVRIDVSREGDVITQMNGEVRQMYAGDMIMRDGGAVSCSVIYGQDNRSPISARTVRALYVAYAPQGVPVDVVERHLAAIEESVHLCCPGALVEQRRLVTA